VLGADDDHHHWRRQLLGELLGDDHTVAFTACLLARTGCVTQDPHADGAHPHERERTLDDALLDAHAVQLFLPLCEMSRAAGPTEFWPTSHLPANAPFASLLPPIALEARPGDAIVRTLSLRARQHEWRFTPHRPASRTAPPPSTLSDHATRPSLT